MFRKISLKFKSKTKDKGANNSGGDYPGAAVPYDPNTDRERKESSIEKWTPDPSKRNGQQQRQGSSGDVNDSRLSEDDGRKLTEAASKADIQALRQLLKSGCDVNARDVHGNSALHTAAHLGKSKIIRFLLLHGADIEAKTKKDKTSIELAVNGGHTGSVGVLLDFMHSVDNRPRSPFVLLRVHKAGTNQHIVERVSSCTDLKPFESRGINEVHLLISHGQRASDLAVFLYSVLDVSVCHAFFLNTQGDLNMRNFQRFETKAQSQSLTVLNTSVRVMETAGYNSLRSLILVSCGLTKITLDGLKNLELLDLSRNAIETMPETLGDCTLLKSIRLSHNKLKQLPREVAKLQKLMILEASNNALRTLTSRVVHCKNLKAINLDHNDLHILPVDIGLLSNLEELSVKYNRLGQLPLSIASLSKLQIIDFHSNPLTNIPRDFPERPKEVCEYLQSLQDDPVPNTIVKLVLVGQEGVGKTTLLSALKRNLWILPKAPITSKTEGIEVKDIQLDGLTFKCFDCGGDVDFNESHRFFITPGSLVLACFNLSEYTQSTVERSSFLLGRLQLWIQYIFSKVPAARVIIVGTHADSSTLKKQVFEQIWELLRSMLVSAREHHRQYFSSHERLSDCLLCQSDSKCLRRASGEGSAGYVNLGCDSSDSGQEETSFSEGPTRILAFPHIVGYYEVSSVKASGNTSILQVTSNQSIDQLKEAIVDVGKRLINANPEIPRKWANTYESLQNHIEFNSNNCATSIKKVADLAKVHGVHDKQELTNMLNFLKAQGNLLFFQQIAELSDLVILDPEWLAKMFATVVSYRDTGIANDGFVERKRLLAMWQSMEVGKMAERLLALLHTFGVCLPIAETDMELFPCRLPIGEPDDAVWAVCPEPQEKQVTYSVTFPSLIPPPLFSELILVVYRYRVAVTCNEESSRYFANVIVENLRLDAVGCRDCLQAARGPPAYLKDDELVHKVLFELVPHKRCIFVTVRGAQPCCMTRTLNGLLNQVVGKYEGLGTIELDTIICPGCYMARHKTSHRFSAKQMFVEASSRQPVTCSNGHTAPSAASILLGNIDDSWMPYMTVKHRSYHDKHDYSGCPKLFVMLPVNREGLTMSAETKLYTSSLLFDGFAVHLVCEFPDGYHLTQAAGYRLKDPLEFVDLYGNHLVQVLRLLGYMADSSVVPLSSHTKAVSRVVTELTADLLARFPHIKDTSAQFTAEQLIQQIQQRGRCFSRQDLRNCLHIMDRPAYFGPLRRLQLNDQTLWVCKDHYRQLRILRVGLKDVEQLDEDSKA